MEKSPCLVGDRNCCFFPVAIGSFVFCGVVLYLEMLFQV